MSSKPERSPTGTVKSKLVIRFTIIFATLATGGFLTAYLELRSYLFNAVDRGLLTTSLRLEGQYSQGEGFEEEEVVLGRDDVPDIIAEAARRCVPGLEIIHAKVEESERGKAYEVMGTVAGNLYEIAIRQDGTVRGVDRRDPSANQRYLSAVFAAETSPRTDTATQVLLLLSPRMNVLATSDLSHWVGLTQALEPIPEKHESWYQTLILPGNKYPVRCLSRRVFDGNTMCLGVSLKAPVNLLRLCRTIFLAVVLGICLLGSVSGWVVAAKAMAGVERVAETAAAITKEHLDARVTVGDEGAEIEALAEAFNDMLSRIQNLVFELREITNNVAHDLRTPLARIRGAIETTVSGSESIESYRHMAGDVVEECDRLVEMINAILEIAQAESGIVDFRSEDVDLQNLLIQACDLFRAPADARAIKVTQKFTGGAAILQGDRIRLQRMVANLLDNAIKYTPEGGQVEVLLDRGDDRLRLRVRNTGAPIPEADRQHVFERFFRCDRSRSLPGNGLGLSLVQAIVHAHRGTVRLDSGPRQGNMFEVCLPCASA